MDAVIPNPQLQEDTVTDQTGFEHIEGLTFRKKNGEIISNPDRKLEGDINSFPPLNRKFIDVETYKVILSKAFPFAKKSPIATLMTSRGCPYDCVFCSVKIMWTRSYRKGTPDRVVKEIDDLVYNYGIKEIAIIDDQFLLDKKRIHEICDHIIEKKMNICLTIPGGTSVWLVDLPLLKKMKQAGFYRLNFPIESGCAKTVKFIKKPVNLKKTLKVIEYATKLGYWTQGNFIIGFPYETKEDILESLDYAYSSGIDYVFFYIAQVYPGTELYEIMKNEGLLNNVDRGSHFQRTNFNTTTLSAEELERIHAKAVNGFLPHKLKFYLKPRNFYDYLLPKFKSIEDIKYALRIFNIMVLGKVREYLRRLFSRESDRGQCHY